MRLSRQVGGVVVSAALLVVVVLLLTGPGAGRLAELRSGAQGLGLWFPVVFFLAYTLVTVFPVPRSTFTYSAAVLFPPALAVPLCLLATGCAAALAFRLVRMLGFGWAARFRARPRVARLDLHIRRRGWLAVASLRLVPAVPFSLLNYVAALSSIPMRQFLVATVIGSAPGTVAAIVLGDSLTTGSGHGALWATAGFTALGLLGLLIDSRLPVRPAR